MTLHHFGFRFGIVTLLVAGCGGTVNLRTPDAGRGGTPGGAGPVTGGSGGLAPGADGAGGRGGSSVSLPARIMAYDADDDGLGRVVYLRALDGASCVQRLSVPGVQAKQPAFSTDATLLAYAALDEDGHYQIHVRDLASGTVERVTTLKEGATSPAFSPSGNQIAFVTGDPETNTTRATGEGSLMLVDLSTHQVTMVLDGSSLGCCVPEYL